jgi:hypothetical protein
MSFGSNLNEAFMSSMAKHHNLPTFQRADAFGKIVSPSEVMFKLNPGFEQSIPQETAPAKERFAAPTGTLTNCDAFIDHVRKCSKCRAKITPDTPYSIPEHVIDTLLYIITCIFILFVLDLFVRLGGLLK